MLDLVVRNGTLVDGTGAPGRRADLGVQEGRIVAIGKVEESARRTLDVEGRVVAPGFVDTHTHLDAQLLWDPTASPSPLHGATTVIGGNCGFTIAPLVPGRQETVMRLLAKVEDIPFEALQAGPGWDWSTTAEYLDRIDQGLVVNAGFLVGHSAIRIAVMGESAREDLADAEQLRAMVQLLREGLSAGGLGFSSAWVSTQKDFDGKMVPSRLADEDELVAFCRETGQHPGTSIEFTPPFPPFGNEQYDLMARMSSAANRHLSYGAFLVRGGMEALLEQTLQADDYARQRGGRALMQVNPAASELYFSFTAGAASLSILTAAPGWNVLSGLGDAEKLALLGDPLQRKRLGEGAEAMREHSLKQFFDWPNMIVFKTGAAETAHYEGELVGDIASREGKDAFDALVDIVVNDRLATLFGPRPADGDADWKLRTQALQDSRAIAGATDTGAHLQLFCSSNFATDMLAEAVRERELLPLEEAVHLVTDRPARMWGLRGRGRVKEGWSADLVVFDPTTVRSGPICTRRDLPGDTPRLFREAVGIDHVIVNGAEVLDHGEFTDSLPGIVLRSGRDTETNLVRSS